MSGHFHAADHRPLARGIQTVLKVIYPPRCVGCGTLVESDFGLCGSCWGETQFIGGLVCDACGVPLPGEIQDEVVHCDDCLSMHRPWAHGRSAILYEGQGRQIVLRLKHGDRHDMVPPAVQWLAGVSGPLMRPDMLVAPIPLHWKRFLKRRYNQSALLSTALAKQLGLDHCPDLLIRRTETAPLDGLGKDARFARLNDAIVPNPKRLHLCPGRPILLVDDVMTSGATFSAATHACQTAQTGEVCVIALARVAKRP